MDKREIEKKAKWLRRQIYEKRREYWPDHEPHPFEMVDPAIAGHVLGIDFQYMRSLHFTIPGDSYERAGLLDRDRRTIVVATRFGDEVARYTAAHELGHWLLHKTERTQHRDTPRNGSESEERDPVEREADYFAAVFLMPAHFVRRIFREMFRTDQPFVFDEATSFHLRPYDVQALLYPERGSKIRERTLASAKSFSGSRFEKSLAEMFHVSVATMAIRINELGLVRAWP